MPFFFLFKRRNPNNKREGIWLKKVQILIKRRNLFM